MAHPIPVPDPFATDDRDVVRELDAGLRLRLIRPDDEPRLIALHERLSAQTAYQRFFTVMRRLPTNWAHFLANVDYHARLALVIERQDGGRRELVAVGRYESTADAGIAEVAFVVEDRWQGKGLGRLLLEELLAAAGARGIRRFRAYVLADNRRMLHLLTRYTRVVERRLDAGVVDLVFERQG
jgi:RimJ/RimL family protein N-acetyltransferase